MKWLALIVCTGLICATLLVMTGHTDAVAACAHALGPLGLLMVFLLVIVISGFLL